MASEEKEKILIVGGDLRIAKAADSLVKDGWDVLTYGLDSADTGAPKADSLSQALSERSIVLLGLPCYKDDHLINAPFGQNDIAFKDLFSQMKKNQVLLGGMITQKVADLADLYNVSYIDYFKREELNVYNAVPTAEGAIEIALSELPITLHGANVLCIGYGRIGRVLCKLLSGFGANVCATSRKCEGLAWITSMGHKALHTSKIADGIEKYDLIFNTIPYHVLTQKELKKLNPNCLVIDLASKPGGAAREIG